MVDDPPLLEARHLKKAYGHVEALRDMSLTLRHGEIHAIVGDNGAGKSTFVHIVAGATEPTGGELLMEGRPIRLRTPVDALEAKIATVYQNLALVGLRDIAENVFLGREPVNRFGFVRSHHMHQEASRLVRDLKQANVTDIYARVADLSGGQRQAVSIAREIGTGSRVLILDEPTAALGVRESREVLSLIAGLKDASRGVIIIAHNLAHVFQVADRITVLRRGRNVGTVQVSETDHDAVVKLITSTTMAE